MNRKKYKLYIHTNIVNNKKYVGITCQELKRRFRKNGEGYKRCTLFYRAIKKYGWENFTYEVLFYKLDESEAKRLEIEFINKYKSNNKKYGYNIDNGGCGIGKVSKETRNKISKSLKNRLKHKENHPFYKKHHTDESKIKISKSKIGKYAGEGNPMYNKHHTEETKVKIRAKVCKKVLCIQTGEVFNSCVEAGKILNICFTSISKVCIGKAYTAGGLKFKYIQEDLQDE